MGRKSLEPETKKEFYKRWKTVLGNSRADDVFDLYANPFYNFFKEQQVPKKSKYILALFIPGKKMPIRCDTATEASKIMSEYIEKTAGIVVLDKEIMPRINEMLNRTRFSFYDMSVLKLCDTAKPNKKRRYY